MTPRFDVMLATDQCVDLLVRGEVRPRFGQVEQLVEGYALGIGGSANIFACQAAKLGLRVGLIGVVGEDPFGRILLDLLRAEGPDLSGLRVDAAVPTGLGLHLTEPDDRAILTVVGTIDATDPADLPAAPERLCRHWHLASFFLLTRLRPAWPDFLRRARAAGVTVSLDTNWDPAERWDGVREILPLCDLFLPNEEELRAISGQADAAEGARALSRLGPVVAVKRGAAGALVARGGEVVAEAPAEPLRGAVVDAVGAGDSFDAGFLWGWLDGRPLDLCLRRAQACAAATLLAAGGTAGQLRAPDLSTLEPCP